jgi:hypothetical protein
MSLLARAFIASGACDIVATIENMHRAGICLPEMPLAYVKVA